MNLYNKIPFISTGQMREVDRAMIEDYGITLIQMMEYAGRNLARLAQRLFTKEANGKPVLILAGSGGNGGGALVCARHLHNWGHEIRIGLSKPDQAFTGIPLHQLNILKKLGIDITSDSSPGPEQKPALIIDGLIGYSLSGPASGLSADWIGWVNQQNCPVLSLDVPSGLDATQGFLSEPVIRATATMTLALPKTGLVKESAGKFVGDLYLADIGVPPQLYARPPLSLMVGNLFRDEAVVKIDY
jgi:NAD(P)H-hydrate epimerase